MAVYRHPELGFGLALPEGARVALELPPVALLHPERDWEFQPAFAVTAEPEAAETVLEDWVAAALGGQARELLGFRALDRGPDRIGGVPATRTLAHYLRGDHAVTLEQWWLSAEGRRWVLSASCATLDFDELADRFEELARGFEPPGG